MTHPLARADLTHEQALALIWALCQDLARHTGTDPAVVALTKGIVPRHRAE